MEESGSLPVGSPEKALPMTQGQKLEEEGKGSKGQGIKDPEQECAWCEARTTADRGARVVGRVDWEPGGSSP